jgi:hypothetical protein
MGVHDELSAAEKASRKTRARAGPCLRQWQRLALEAPTPRSAKAIDRGRDPRGDRGHKGQPPDCRDAWQRLAG